MIPKIYLSLVTSQLPTQSDFPGGLCLLKGVTEYIVSVWAPFLTHAPLTQAVAVSACAGAALCPASLWEGVPQALVCHRGGISTLKSFRNES